MQNSFKVHMQSKEVCLHCIVMSPMCVKKKKKTTLTNPKISFGALSQALYLGPAISMKFSIYSKQKIKLNFSIKTTKPNKTKLFYFI